MCLFFLAFTTPFFSLPERTGETDVWKVKTGNALRGIIGKDR